MNEALRDVVLILWVLCVAVGLFGALGTFLQLWFDMFPRRPKGGPR